MDERTLEVIIKAENETKAAFVEIQASLAELSGSMAVSKGLAAASSSSFLGMTLSLQGMMPVIAGLLVVLAPFIVALGALLAEAAALSILFTVGVGAIGALAGAIALLGIHAQGGANAQAALTTANTKLAAAAEAHENAVRALAEAYVKWGNSTAQIDIMRLQDAQERARDTAAKLTAAQQAQADAAANASGSFAALTGNIGDMVDAWATKASPMADKMFVWLDGLLPRVQSAGMSILDWFGQRLPGILQFATGVVNILAGAFQTAASAIGSVIDYVLKNQSSFLGFFQGVVTFAVGAFVWLLNAAMDIDKWFKANWPGIVKWVSDFVDGFKVWQPLIAPALKDIGDRLGDISSRVSTLQPLWALMGTAIGAMVTVAMGALEVLVETLSAIIAAIQWISQNVSNATGSGHYTGGGHGGIGGPRVPSIPSTLGAPFGSGALGHHGL